MAVLVVAADNTGGGGSHNIEGVSDTKSNTWTIRRSPLYDPGTASSGVQGIIATTSQDGGLLTTGDTITVQFGNNTTAKAWTLMQVSAGAGSSPQYLTGAENTGSATASPTVTTSSITSGDMVIGGLFNERGTDQTVTGDSDTSNGTWSAQQTAEIGSTASGITVQSQRKVTTGTATQTYNPTLGVSSDVVLSWISIDEVSDLVTVPGSFTGDSVLQATIAASFSGDSVLFKTVTQSALADAILKGTIEGSMTADALLSLLTEEDFTADAIILAPVSNNFTSDSILFKTIDQSVVADSILRTLEESSFDADSIIQRIESDAFTGDGILLRETGASFSADSWLLGPIAGSFSADAVLHAIISGNFTANSILLLTEANTFSADALLSVLSSSSFTADAVLEALGGGTVGGSFTGYSILQRTEGTSFAADALLSILNSGSFTANAILQGGVSAQRFNAKAVIVVLPDVRYIIQRGS
jgi:hypothetical protein